MPRNPRSLIYAGIREYVVALDAGSGEIVWQTELKQQDYTTVLWDGEMLIAANAGEVFRLDPATGDVLWANELKGMGRGLVSLASSRRGADSVDSMAAAKAQRDAAQAAAAAG
jgi:outer membrane protein assembly factor BamB